jgi:quercetin dioxygenase-like cupin family protein
MQEVRERIYHPGQKDYATFLKTSAETNGEYSLFEIEVAPEGGNSLHAHGVFTEEFKVIEGELNVQVGEQHMVLKPGESALVPLGVAHRFYNTSDKRTVFHVELRPGHQGFEQTLRIAYRMADVKQGVIKNLLTFGVLVELSDTKITDLGFVMQPLFRLLASLARRSGLDKELMAQYGQPQR